MRQHAMFTRKYKGDFHRLFVGALDDYQKIYDRQKHFGRIIPIIQSSGTGKSPPDIPARDLLLRQQDV